MGQPQRIEIEEEFVYNIRLRLIEKDCPKCDAVLEHNHNEQCYECLNCGYIDCGDED